MLEDDQNMSEDFPCLAGQFLIAMPGMLDPRFEKAVIYLCAHSADGAMGLIVNQAIDTITFSELLDQLAIKATSADPAMKIHFGGPVEFGRGFILHTKDYLQDATLIVDDDLALTATLDILKEIATGRGPHRFLLALGYTGWGPGQLDGEIKSNGWLSVAADKDLVFDRDLSGKWSRAMETNGINPKMLSEHSGHA